MNKMKKLGLTALAGSMVAVSAQAAEMTTTGVASWSMTKGSETGKTTYSMSNHVKFSGTSELDNGFEVTYSLEFDGDEGDAGGSLDNPTLSINTNGMGTLTFHGEGGSGAMSAMDDKTPNAYEEAFDGLDSSTTAVVINGYAGKNMFNYKSEDFNGAVVTVGFIPTEDTAVTNGNNSTYIDFGVTYTPDMVEGLELGYAMGTTEITAGSEVDESTMYATYAIGGLTVGYQISDYDAASATNSDDSIAIGVSYAVNDDLSVSYNEHTVDVGSTSTDQEAEGISASYTMGGITIAGHSNEMKAVGGTSGVNDEGYEINVSFAF